LTLSLVCAPGHACLYAPVVLHSFPTRRSSDLDPVSATDTLTATDTANMGNLPWKEVFRDPKLQALIEEGLANNVDMQAAILRVRSEEHTSELQSRFDLVCRLLLETKK